MTLSPACGSFSTRSAPEPTETGPAAWTVEASLPLAVLDLLELLDLLECELLACPLADGVAPRPTVTPLQPARATATPTKTAGSSNRRIAAHLPVRSGKALQKRQK